MNHDKIKRPEEKKNSASLSSAENSTKGGTTLVAPALQFKKEGEEEESLQMKKGSSSGGNSSSSMPDEVRGKMENSFQSDFSNVNFHTNSQSATDVGALAYAQGNDVHFAPGQFKPNTQSGQELIGHELAHVVQQRQGRVQPTAQAKGLAVNDDKGLEAEADRMGKSAAIGETVNVFQAKNKVNSKTIQKQGARPDEIALALTDPLAALIVKGNATKAFAAAQNSGLPFPRDGEQDAFRHAYWNALNARDIINRLQLGFNGAGGTARAGKFATLHELGMNPAADAENPAYDPIAIKMDLHNNLVGRSVGAGNLGATDAELAQMIMSKLNSGNLKVISRNAAGQYIDSAGNSTTDRKQYVLVNSGTSSPSANSVETYDRTY